MKAFLLMTTALVVCSSGAFAADLAVYDEPVIAPASEALTGYVELGGQAVSWMNSEESDGNASGLFGGFGLWYNSGSFRLGVDGYADYLTGQNGVDDVPEGVQVLGLHAGANIDELYFGAFGSVGRAPDEYNEAYLTGYTVGVEGKADIGNATLFAHAGYADTVIVDGYSGFTGTFGDVGVAMNLTDDFAVMVKGGIGYAPIRFEDDQGSGTYATAEIKGLYLLPTEFPLALTASYEFGAFIANSEDTGYTHTFKVGLSVPFGAATAKDALNVLATTTTPYRAASWGEKLD